MSELKIVSIAPNITRIVDELGAESYATTTHTKVGKVEVGGWLNPDIESIESMNPDMVFTSDGLQDDVYSELQNRGLETIHYEPARFEELFSMIDDVGRKIGYEDEANSLISELRSRVEKVEKFVSGRQRPVVYCEEWDKPPMAAGNWIPDMVEIAGGEYPFVEPGNRSQEITEYEYENKNPDIFVSHICGAGQMDNFRDIRQSWDYPEKVYFVDDDYMNQLSPNTVLGIENLASIIHQYPVNEKRYVSLN